MDRYEKVHRANQRTLLASGTLKNKLSVLRWWAEKVDKRSVIARDNTHYGIANRVYVTNENNACEIDVEQLEKIKDPRVRASLELQRAFGFRHEVETEDTATESAPATSLVD